MAPETIYLICECGKAIPTGLFLEATEILTAKENYKERITKCNSCGKETLWGKARFVSEVYAKGVGKL